MQTQFLMVYLMAGLAGFSAITLVMLAVRGKKGEKPVTLYYMTGFALSNFLLGIFYMFESFRYCMDGSFECRFSGGSEHKMRGTIIHRLCRCA